MKERVIVRTTIRPFGDTTRDPFLHSLRHWVVLILNTSPFHRKHTLFMYVGSFDGRSILRETGRCLPESWHNYSCFQRFQVTMQYQAVRKRGRPTQEGSPTKFTGSCQWRSGLNPGVVPNNRDYQPIPP